MNQNLTNTDILSTLKRGLDAVKEKTETELERICGLGAEDLADALELVKRYDEELSEIHRKILDFKFEQIPPTRTKTSEEFFDERVAALRLKGVQLDPKRQAFIREGEMTEYFGSLQELKKRGVSLVLLSDLLLVCHEGAVERSMPLESLTLLDVADTAQLSHCFKLKSGKESILVSDALHKAEWILEIKKAIENLGKPLEPKRQLKKPEE